jgi:thiol-disulfide isomerase/thioredoxin
MKKFTIYLVLATLCLYFPARAQQNITARGLQTGQPLPASAGLSAYRGRLLILDFWATWCAPCRTLLPHADSLNRRFAGRAVILPVTYESRSLAAPVLEKLLGHPVNAGAARYGDVALHRLFPHKVIPHEVWIDSSGTVRAFTEGQGLTVAAITAALRGQLPAARKTDLALAYDASRPLLAAGNGGDGKQLAYHSLLTRYIPGLYSGTSISKYDTLTGQRFSVRNTLLPWLFRMAYGEGGRQFSAARLRLSTRDSLSMRSPGAGKIYEDWLAAGHGYCYELQVPPYLVRQAFPIMQADMARLFPQYRVTVEKEKVRCLVLVKTGPDSLLASRGGPYLVQVTPFACRLRQATLRQLMMRLDQQYLQNSPLPLVDGTGYVGRVDLDFAANMSSVPELNRALARYGLQLREQNAETELLYVRDTPGYRLSKP